MIGAVSLKGLNNDSSSSQDVIGRDFVEAFGGCTTKHSIFIASRAGQWRRCTVLDERAIRKLLYSRCCRHELSFTLLRHV